MQTRARQLERPHLRCTPLPSTSASHAGACEGEHRLAVCACPPDAGAPKGREIRDRAQVAKSARCAIDDQATMSPPA